VQIRNLNMISAKTCKMAIRTSAAVTAMYMFISKAEKFRVRILREDGPGGSRRQLSLDFKRRDERKSQ
jgi:predicted metal-dependent hydrolase